MDFALNAALTEYRPNVARIVQGMEMSVHPPTMFIHVGTRTALRRDVNLEGVLRREMCSEVRPRVLDKSIR
jgi:hypothetical protein